ncbi:outer membrane protein [Dysgonomonas hofstadii]|uniref:Outer membrane protein n=1 Tax=Dysgonomonas hofstadii TaxID=637886 RepID=A0A840D050_9BACT|nr:TolC family protein [Dysgonomonas hofstadii]MBB4038022.1 outer membrane protein [Dysgonomonas hofstadii]
MKKYIFTSGLFLICLSSFAQQKWTLRECVDHAIENNIELRQQALNVKSAEVDLSTSKNSRLPNLNASAGQDFNFGRSIRTSTNTVGSGNVGSTSIGLSSSIPLFTGFRIPNQIKQDEFDLLAATEGLKKAQENLELQVVSLFLDVLFKKEILKAYQDQLTLSNQQVEKTQILVESGKVPASQLFDMKAQAARDELNVTMSKNDLDLSLLNLSQSLNLQQQGSFDVVEPDIANALDNSITSIIPVDQVYQVALGTKPQIKEAEYKIESSKKGLKIAQADYYPSLDMNMRYSTGFDHVYKSGYDNPSISSQLGSNQTKYIGFSLSIPIFNRFRVRNQVRTARLNIENQTLAMDNIKLALYKEIQQAYQSATSAQAKYNSTEKALDAAEESFKYARERYDIGKSTVFEYNEAQTKLLTSQSDQIQAKYDFIFRSKILDFYQGKPIDIQ